MIKHVAMRMTLLLIIISILSLSACSSIPLPTQPHILQPSQDSGTSPINPDWTPPSEDQQPVLPSITRVVTKVRPSVVAINVKAVTYDIFNRPTQVQGAGSGWIIDTDGYIVTNNHVVEGADSITVTLSDGSTFSANDVKTDPLTDLAVINIDAQNLPALDIGDSSSLEIGDWVIAVGNALGMGISATSGIVSALDVSLSESADQTLYGLIQTDAAINPGNSGGPLVNLSGQVIGIDSIKIAQVGVEGMGYAIGINEAIPVVAELIKTGYITRPWLGVGVATVNQMVAAFYDIPVDTGVLVTEVTANSPADKAGLNAGDVITAVEGEKTNNVGDMMRIINLYEIAQEIEITFWRGQMQDTVTLTLGESPPPKP